MEWGLPRANQAFRELVHAQSLTGRRVHLEPGLNELGFSRLGQRTDRGRVRLYHLLVGVVLRVAPVEPARVVRRPAHPRRHRPPSPSRSQRVVVYYARLWVSDSYLRGGAALPILVAWAPNALFLAAALG